MGLFGIQVRSDLPDIIDPEPQTGVTPPRRTAGTVVTVDRALSMPAIYRGFSVLATTGSQLGIDVERDGQRLPDREIPALVRRPSLDMTRSEWISALILSLAATGEGWLHAPKYGGPTAPSIDILPSHHVGVSLDKGRRVVTYKGEKLNNDEVRQLAFMKLPGRLRGIGPIQAAREGLASLADMRNYLNQWWTDGPSQPTGALSSDQALNSVEALRYRDIWNGLDPDTHEPAPQTANPSGIKVLGKGLSYEPLLMSPKDVMWIEAQNYGTVEIARLLGIPSSLMLTSVEGSSRTYANVEQEWIAFVRFTLMGYLRPIEEALTDLTPRGQTVRFSLENLLRSDTKTRYEAHAIAIVNKWMDPEEVRVIENLPPRTTPAQGAA